MVLITEVWVSIDGLEFIKLNLHKDESIPMKYTTKDLQNLSKIFSPYSLSFTFPADSKNRAAFGFFGDTDVIKINPDNKFITKIYTNGNINLQGFIQLEDLDYDNFRPTDFTGSFATSMSNLAERIGDDLIADLPEDRVGIDWTPANVFSLMSSKRSTTVDGVPLTYFVPLISNNRVWNFDLNFESALKDNVAYDALVDPLSTGVIKSSELRPVMSFSTIIELIKKKYNLDVVAPLDDRKEYTELVVLCSNESMYSPEDTQLTIKTNMGGRFHYDDKHEGGVGTKKYTPTTDLINNSFHVTKNTNNNNWTKYFTLRTTFTGVIITGGSTEPKVNLKIKRVGTDEVLASKSFDLNGTEFFCELQILDEFLINDEIDFYVTAQFNQPTVWSNCEFRIWYRYYDGKTGAFSRRVYATYANESKPNDNSADVSGTAVDLFRSLPEIKVVDFLTSYFKLFNLSVFDTSPKDDRLYWLTPGDVKTNGLVYSRAEVDYTPYISSSKFKKSVPNEFNYYNFKHAESEYRSNIDFLAATGLEYGQVKHPLIKPAKPIEFSVETIFSLMVPVLLAGSNEIITYYGFDGDAPEILDTGESRYAPNYGELAIFYSVGNTSLNDVLGVQSSPPGGGVINAPLSSYMKLQPINTEANTIAFSILKELGIEYPESLFKRYYQAQTERLLDPNVLSQEFTLELPPDEIYLNEATTIQGSGETPKGFRLQNDVILKEDKFSILDATIDITTGKTKIILLNY
jgi:hypothetical protein